jgi:hypothetical protein
MSVLKKTERRSPDARSTPAKGHTERTKPDAPCGACGPSASVYKGLWPRFGGLERSKRSRTRHFSGCHRGFLLAASGFDFSPVGSFGFDRPGTVPNLIVESTPAATSPPPAYADKRSQFASATATRIEPRFLRLRPAGARIALAKDVSEDKRKGRRAWSRKGYRSGGWSQATPR